MTKIIPYEYEDIAEDLKKQWRNKGYDVDSNASNTAILTDLMAYAINIVNTNMSFGLSDITLNSSEQRKNILALARQIGYEATLKKSFQYKVYLRVKEPTVPVSPFTGLYPPMDILRYSNFSAGEKSYYYLGEDISIEPHPRDFENGEYIPKEELAPGVWSPIDGTDEHGVQIIKKFELIVKEGTLIRYQDNAILSYTIGVTTNNAGTIVEENFIDIPYKNIENDGVFVYVTPVNDQGNELSQEWKKRDSLIVEQNEDFKYSNEYLQLRNIEKETVRVYFTFAGMGNPLLVDTKIDVDIIVSSGTEGIASEKITLKDALVETNYEIITELQSDIPFITGTDEEVDEDIKTNAPMFFNSGNRLVTTLDYKTFIESNSLVKNAFIWGGEDELVKQLGNVWFSLLSANIPRTFTNVNDVSFEFKRNDLLDAEKMYLLDADINNIKKEVSNLKVITIELNDRHPVFIDFFYEIEMAKYSSINKAYVHNTLFDIMKKYFFEELEQYDVDYYNSTLIKKMDVSAGDSSGFDYTFKTKINFFRAQIKDELAVDGSISKKIVMNLAVNEQKIYGVSDINVDVLPSIFGKDFNFDIESDEYKDLYVDFDTPLSNLDKTNQLISFKIYLGLIPVGIYNFVNTIRDKSVRIDIDIDGVTLRESDFNIPKTADVDFKSKNFGFVKNTVPRLAGVKFI